MKNYFSLLSVFFVIVLMSCHSDKPKPPVDLSNGSKKAEVSIPYQEVGGVKTIPIKINGVSIDAIYDPGCSDVQLSLHELQTLDKNGKLNIEDIIGASYATIADGSTVVNGIIVLREIEIGSGKNAIKLQNVQAGFSLNDDAPVLLGNGVFDKVASVEVDNVEKTINFRRY